MISVIGCGRSGTNVVLEILRGNSKLAASTPPENKGLCKNIQKYPEDYLTKCDTCYISYRGLEDLIKANPHLKIVWTIRDPRDMAMSKLRRGVPEKQGGDCKVLADDATPDGLYDDIAKMYSLYRMIHAYHSKRLFLVKMENMIMFTEDYTKVLCDELGLKYEPSMIDFVGRMRVQAKRSRYNKIDRGQVSLWKSWDKAYQGWLKEKGFDMDSIFKRLQNITDYYGY